MTENKFLVSENTIMWAFRYALPRRSGVYVDVTTTLKRLWKDLSDFTRDQIQIEIQMALDRGEAGDAIDSIGWRDFLEWTKEATNETN